MQHIKNKNIILCVCGGIAAYKSVELLRLIKKQGANAQIIMTQNAKAFVGKLTFEALSGNSVCDDLLEQNGNIAIKHIEWAKKADIVVIAPATANIIGKIANGIADDALTTFMLAVKCPTIICPSMNANMFENKAVQRNLQTLKADGHFVMEPETGQLACGTSGPGRFPKPSNVMDRIENCLSPKDFAGKQILVTAGPTQEFIDPVRFISNPSSGKMGYAIARAAEHRGAQVTLITGPVNLVDPLNIDIIKVQTADEMANAVFEYAKNFHIIIKTAAVSDYSIINPSKQKIKKDKNSMTLNLCKNQDILKELGKRKKNHQILVGFAAETENLVENAHKKLIEKNADIIVGNLVGSQFSAFQSDTNKATLFYKNGINETLPSMEKIALAHILLDRILKTKSE